MTKTTQAHGVRGLSTPEQARSHLEDLSYKLHSLAEIVKLAAFSDENATDVLFYVSDEMENLRPGLEDARAVLARVASPSEADSVTVTKGGAA